MQKQEWSRPPLLLAAIHGQLGNEDEARRALDRAKDHQPTLLRTRGPPLSVHNTPEDLIDQVIDGLLKAGLNPAPPVD